MRRLLTLVVAFSILTALILTVTGREGAASSSQNVLSYVYGPPASSYGHAYLTCGWHRACVSPWPDSDLAGTDWGANYGTDVWARFRTFVTNGIDCPSPYCKVGNLYFQEYNSPCMGSRVAVYDQSWLPIANIDYWHNRYAWGTGFIKALNASPSEAGWAQSWLFAWAIDPSLDICTNLGIHTHLHFYERSFADNVVKNTTQIQNEPWPSTPQRFYIPSDWVWYYNFSNPF